MRLVRFGKRGAERAGVLDRNDRVRDLSGHVADIAGPVLAPASLARLAAIDVEGLPFAPDPVELTVPVGGIGKVIGIGPNFDESAQLAGFRINPEPTVFMKAPTAVSGPNDPIELPRLSTRTDWGVELGVVIGATAKYVSVEQAMDYVAGFALCNDVTERSLQLQRGGQWFKGKSHDSFAPIGPWLVTKDEMPNWDETTIWLDVNGVRQQEDTVGHMIFKVPYLVSYISRFTRLEAGDVIMTGTPGGVGLSYDPPRFLGAGDRVRLGGDKLGVQDHVCIAPWHDNDR